MQSAGRWAEKVGLLGTAFTMEKPFYRDRIAANGIEAFVPNTWDRQTVHDAIFSELAIGICSDATRTRLHAEAAVEFALG